MKKYIYTATPLLLAYFSKHVLKSDWLATMFAILFFIACVILIISSVKWIQTELNEEKQKDTSKRSCVQES